MMIGQSRLPINLPGIVGSVVVLATAWVVSAAAPVKVTANVASPADITAEIDALLTSADEATSSAESYSEHHGRLKRQAIQIAIFAQAVAEHDVDSPLKKSAPGLRNASLALSRAASLEEAQQAITRLKEATEGKLNGTPAVDVEWAKLARASALMPLMKERSESVRRALRRPKDPEVESRHAMAIALMILAVHGDTHAVKNAADKPAWQETCIELQGHMSLAAAAIKSRDSAAADHFRRGMEACDKCHLQFKP